MTPSRSIRNVTVFGGSTPGSQGYQQAYQLGALLGEHGYTVLTGGYIGTMEAVSRGASEAGAHVIGVTCDEIENWRKVKPNAWVKEDRRFPTMRQRLFALIETCDAAPGFTRRNRDAYRDLSDVESITDRSARCSAFDCHRKYVEIDN